MKRFYFYLLLILTVLPAGLYAQNVRLQGTVTDENGRPLPGAVVVQKGTATGGITDEAGVFAIDVPQGATLSVSYLGFHNKEVGVQAGQTSIVIAMSPEAQTLDDVVVVGYGTQRVRDMTAPITTVKGSDLAKQVAPNPMSALQGKMAGVQITNSGAPGAGPSVRIRGTGSIGDYTNPLYVVDGVFVDNIDFLSSSDIEDLTVLKDASAAAIYGVRAANGVVLITTRRGSTDRTSVTYDGYAGLQVPVNVMKLADREQYVELQNLANQNTTGYVPKNPSDYPASTDWYNELLRNAVTHSHSVDVSGASDKTNYSVGVNYFYQEGIMDAKNDYERINIRARVDQEATSWLKLGANVILSDYNRQNPDNDAFFQAFVNPPVYGVYDETNTAAYPVKFGSAQQYGFGNSYGNPYARAYYNDNLEKGLNLVFSAYLDINLWQDKLKFKTSYNLDHGSWKTRIYQPEYMVGGSQGLTSPRLEKTFGIRKKQIIDNVLTFADRSGVHNYSVMLGQSTRIERTEGMTGSALNVPNYGESSLYIKNGSASNRNVTDDNPAPFLYRGLSFFARATYGYDNRYLATVTFRADGSSKYNDHWGFFPSVGLGWVISEEGFMKDGRAFDFLKLRLSWGQLGNDNIPANSMLVLGKAGYGSSAVFGDDKLYDGQGAQTVYQNFLKWEVVDEWDAGIDFSTLRGRLNGEIDYYNRTTRNVVFSAPIAAGGGTAELLGNYGTVRNSGFEVSVRWNDRVGEHFAYNIGLNATTIKNKVISLNGLRDYIPGASVRGNFATRTQVGYPIGAFWGYEVDGVYASEAEALRDPVSQTIKDAGYFKYRNQNDDTVIDEADKVYLGSPIPWLIMGFDFGFEWKGLDFNLTLQSQIGNKILNAKRMNRDVFADGNYDLDFYNNAWRADSKSSTYPSPEAYNTGFIQQANDFFVEDGSYFRIQNIQLGYTFRGMKWMNSIRVYVAAQRPFTYFGYNGFTPEISGSPIATGVDTNTYPMQAVYTLGLNLNF